MRTVQCENKNYNMRYPLLIALVLLLKVAEAINFDLPSQSPSESLKNPFCLSVFIGTDVLVSGFVKTGPAVGTRLDVSISDSKGNIAFAKNGISDEVRFTFRTNAPEPRDYQICFFNGRQQQEIPRGTYFYINTYIHTYI